MYKANDAGTGIKLDASNNKVAYQVSGSNGRKVDATATSGNGTDKNSNAGKNADNAVTSKVNTDSGIVDKAVYGAGLAVFEKIPPGTYFIKEEVSTDTGSTTGAPKIDATNTAANAPRYEPVEEMYKLVLDGKGYYTIYVAGTDTDGKPDWIESKIETAPVTTFASDGNGKYTVGSTGTDTVDIYTVMNVSPLKRKVILKKVEGGTYTPLGDASDTTKQAKFTVYYADKQTVVEIKHVTGTGASATTTLEKLENLTSGASGVFWIGELPFGTYYLEETQAPNGYTKPTRYFVLKVDAVGVTQLEATKASGSTQGVNELMASSREEDTIQTSTNP